MKYQNKKREKLKTKSKKIYDLLYDLAKPKEQEQEEEEEEVEVQEDEQDPIEQIKERYHNEEPENNTDYFENNYKNKEPVEEIKPPKREPEPEPEPAYQQDYEAKIDQIGGFIRLPSRRDRLNFKNFNI